MSTNSSQSSAKILKFPTKAALAAGGFRSGGRVEVETQVALVEFGSGWYHEAAVRDAQSARKF